MDRDHDHLTGLPRGLACPGNMGCNALMPRQLTLERARLIVAYLERVEAASRVEGAAAAQGQDGALSGPEPGEAQGEAAASRSCQGSLDGTAPAPGPESASAASRCGFVTAAGVRCALSAGHREAHDTTYMLPPPDALPERPEPVDEPLPEDLERLLRNPEIVTDRDGDVARLIADHLRRDLTVETVPRDSYLMLFALYERAMRDA